MRARDGLAALALALLAARCSSEAGPPPGAPAAGAPEPVRVQLVAPEPVAAPEAFESSLFIERDVWLTARGTGVVQQVLVDRGQRVREGQTLVLLETDLEQGQLEIAEQRLRLARAEYERVRTLHEQQIVSAQEALRREIDRDLAASEVTLARARLDRCHVRAPFTGTIVERTVVPGQRVVEEDSVPLLRLVADDALLVRVDVPEAWLATLAVGGVAHVAVADPEPAEFPARIVFVSPVVDAGSGTGSVVAQVRREGRALRPGAAVRVRFDGTGAPPASLFRVPRDAFFGERVAQPGPATLLVAVDGRAAAREVRVVELGALHATVRGGLAATDRVIVGGRPGLVPGDAVELAGAAR